MPPNTRPELRGPIEDLPWSSKLEARVFTPGVRPRVHGFDVYGDVAQHYRASDLVLTSLRGEPPSAGESELFDAVLTFLAPYTAGEAATHAALLSRACAATASAVAAVGATLLAEHAAAVVEHHAPLLHWLETAGAPFPDELRCRIDEEREVVGLFARRVERSGLELSILAHDPTLLAVLFAACHRCGLLDGERLLAVMMAARLPSLLAEAFAAARGERRAYPIDVPAFRYVHEREEDEGEGP